MPVSTYLSEKIMNKNPEYRNWKNVAKIVMEPWVWSRQGQKHVNKIIGSSSQ